MRVRSFNQLRKRAKEGDAEAQYHLGKAYANGTNGVVKNSRDAFKWFRRSAEQGNSKGQNALGVSYAKGWGVDKDLTEAFKWYCKAAELGDAGAEYNLGQCYENGDGSQQNLTEAVKWYRRSAEQGDADAQCRLGLCYQNGDGVNQDIGEALDWYRRSAGQGNADAQCLLGLCYQNGDGVDQDIGEALKWYRMSAEQGNADAQFYLAACFENGNGVDEDVRQATSWYRKAAECGNEGALANLRSLVMNGNKDAFDATLELAKQGIADAANLIGECYENKWYVEQDHQAAYNWYLQAASRGNSDARTRLQSQDFSQMSIERSIELTAETRSLKKSLKKIIKCALDSEISEENFLFKLVDDLDSADLSDCTVFDTFCTLFDRSAWYAVNQEGQSLAEISLDDRVPPAIRDHARAALEKCVADSAADPTCRSAAARALHLDDLTLSSSTSFSDIPFGNLPIFADNASDPIDFSEIMNAIDESARRVPKNIAQQLRSLVDMLHSVDTPEISIIARLQQLFREMESLFEEINDQKRRLERASEHHLHENNEQGRNLEIHIMEDIQNNRDLLDRHLRSIEPIISEVREISPQSDTIPFPQIEGRADRISPSQLNDILAFIRNDHGSIAWHQQSVVDASKTLMRTLRTYATALYTVRSDVDQYHSFMEFFLAHVNDFCSTKINKARQQMDQIAQIRSDWMASIGTENSIKPFVQVLQSIRQEIKVASETISDLQSKLKIKKEALSANQNAIIQFASTQLAEECKDTKEILASKILKFSTDIGTLGQALDIENQKMEGLKSRERELADEIWERLRRSGHNTQLATVGPVCE